MEMDGNLFLSLPLSPSFFFFPLFFKPISHAFPPFLTGKGREPINAPVLLLWLFSFILSWIFFFSGERGQGEVGRPQQGVAMEVTKHLHRPEPAELSGAAQ